MISAPNLLLFALSHFRVFAILLLRTSKGGTTMKFAHALNILVLALNASTAPAGDKKEDAVPIVSVSKPVQRTVTDFADYTSRVSPKDTVAIQPRVSGYLNKVSFKEGAEVKEGDVLYEIDPRLHQAQVEAARAKLALAEATLKLARMTNARIKSLAKKGAASQEEADHAQAQEEQAVAALELDKANLKTAMIHLDWTVIRAPIAGKIGGSELTVGNLVKGDA